MRAACRMQVHSQHSGMTSRNGLVAGFASTLASACGLRDASALATIKTADRIQVHGRSRAWSHSLVDLTCRLILDAHYIFSSNRSLGLWTPPKSTQPVAHTHTAVLNLCGYWSSFWRSQQFLPVQLAKQWKYTPSWTQKNLSVHSS